VLSAILIKTGRHRQAYEVSKKTLKLSFHKMLKFIFNLGVMLKSLGNIHQAEKHYRRAIQLKPDFADSLSKFSKCHKSFT
jgi:tetratricopeptide (TPR) repeat protein